MKTPRSRKSSGRVTTRAKLLRKLYRALLTPRVIEEKMLLLLRQGQISKWFSGIGQEAIAVGVTAALADDEYILPLHRNLGVFTTRAIPLSKLIAQWQGKHAGFTKGRDRSFHFGTNEHHIVGMISHLGPQLAVADGIALAHRLRKERKVTAVFTGEGGTSEGDFHEALNVAAVWDLPVLFIVENNGYALSTPTREQFRCEQLSDRAAGYGIEGITIDGNDLMQVYETVRDYATKLRASPRPVLIECMTFRMRGHEEASGTKYVPPALIKEWEQRDPVLRFEKLIRREKIFTPTEMKAVRAEILAEVEQAIEAAFAEADPVGDSEAELADVYAPAPTIVEPARGGGKKLRFVDAISDGLREAMRAHETLVLMGQDIAEYGGVFKVTDGFLKEFGKARVRNTPLCESAILGAAFGLSVKGIKSVVEMQFADFVSSGFNQIVNNLAKSHYRWGQCADVVVRMPTGAGTSAGPFHSQSNEAWFTKTPGLKVVYPAFPSDAKGLLLAAIADPNPVLFFEHKLLYRSISEEVPDGLFETPIGKARVLCEGDDVTILTYGMGVHWVLELLKAQPEIAATVVDLRTLAPLDLETIFSAVRATGRVCIVHEDTLTGGIGGELAALISEHCFESLDAPITRVASLDTPIPFASPLEGVFLAKNRLKTALLRVLEY